MLLAFSLALTLHAAPVSFHRGAHGEIEGVALGLSEESVKAKAFKPIDQMDGWYRRGAHRVRVEGAVVVVVAYAMTAAQAQTVGKAKKPQLEHLAMSLGGCGPVQHGSGGSMIACRDQLLISETRAGFELWLDAALKAPEVICQLYLVGAGGPVPKDKVVCLNSKVLPSGLTLAAHEKDPTWGACDTVRAKGSAMRRCNGTVLHFSSTDELVRIELSH